MTLIFFKNLTTEVQNDQILSEFSDFTKFCWNFLLFAIKS